MSKRLTELQEEVAELAKQQKEEGHKPKELTDTQLREALTKMHVGLVTMQARLDDHEKVIEKLMLVMQNLTEGHVPKGFRQPKAN
jgi:seryl-tRNA synthetase